MKPATLPTTIPSLFPATLPDDGMSKGSIHGRAFKDVPGDLASLDWCENFGLEHVGVITFNVVTSVFTVSGLEPTPDPDFFTLHGEGGVVFGTTDEVDIVAGVNLDVGDIIMAG
jgi:hypothetical protein